MPPTGAPQAVHRRCSTVRTVDVTCMPCGFHSKTEPRRSGPGVFVTAGVISGIQVSHRSMSVCIRQTVGTGALTNLLARPITGASRSTVTRPHFWKAGSEACAGAGTATRTATPSAAITIFFIRSACREPVTTASVPDA